MNEVIVEKLTHRRKQRRTEFLGSPVAMAFAFTLGLTVLCLLLQILPLISPRHMTIYHFDGLASELFLPVLVNLAVLWMVLAGLILLARGSAAGTGRLHATIWSGILLMVPWVALKEGTIASAHTFPHTASVPLVALPFAGMIAVNLFWRPRVRAFLEQLLPACKAFLLALSLTGGMILLQLFYFFVRSSGLNDPQPLHVESSVAVRGAGEPKRVIVLLFDELSYEQVYGNRSPRVTLPAFDRLAAESAVFRDVKPAAEFTERAIPSLLTGRTVEEIRASPDGRRLAMQDQHGWTRLNPEDTVFADALKQGYRTGLAGWYNPYCRILPQVLDRCQWSAHATVPNVIALDSPLSGRNLLENSLEPARYVLRAIPGFFVRRLRYKEPESDLAERHEKDYQQIVTMADSLLSDSSMTFVFLHLPVPHQGGIFDRRTGAFTRHTSSYLDNLALADVYLAHARELLEQSGDWDDSAVVVLGDHSWRTWMWGDSAFWTEEDRAVSAGKNFDDRPALVVKLPKGRGGTHIDTAFEAKRTRWLLDELMTGKIGTAEDLAKWTEEQ
jgi:hypothetical protein